MPSDRAAACRRAWRRRRPRGRRPRQRARPASCRLPQARPRGVQATAMECRRISSAMPMERQVGSSRAVVAGSHVYVSGTAPVMPDGADPPADAYGQARRCLQIIQAALAEGGAGVRDGVRTRIYVTDAALIADAGRAHAEVFGDVRPATTGVVVGLLDPRRLVEIEGEGPL